MSVQRLVIGLNAVIVAVTEETPRILTVQRADHPLADAGDDGGEPLPALPFGPLDPEGDRTLELGLRGWVREQTGLELGYAEQLYTFADRDREPARRPGGPRVVSVAYLALVREGRLAGGGEARWRDWYRFFPWEDWRHGRPALIDDAIAPALRRWADGAAGGGRCGGEDDGTQAVARRASGSGETAAGVAAGGGGTPSPGAVRGRRERVDITFGLGGVAWDGERVLERYELLYEAGLVAEALREHGGAADVSGDGLGEPMAFDHRRILATALGRLRGKIRYRPVVFELLPPTFTLYQLQRVVEALAGMPLHKGNFRRLVENAGLVEGTGRLDTATGGRPAELFRFRRDVLRERPAPGVGLPGVRV